MLITRHDVRVLEGFFDEIVARARGAIPGGPHSVEDLVQGFFALRPHLLFPMGFDEFVALQNRETFSYLWDATTEPLVDAARYSVFRKPTGRWFWLWGVPEPEAGELNLWFRTKGQAPDYPQPALSISADDLLDKLEKSVGLYTAAEKLIWTPALWTRESQAMQRMSLASTTQGILRAVHSERLSLDSIHWRQLEEVVAELLRAKGLEIHVVKENPQGGRDIIARGELIPGEKPIVMAVEVKHKRVVCRPEVQTALRQNRYYPALLFATSGRFSAGVLKEKELPDTRMRLFLKDGEAIGDLIHDYFRRSQ